MSEFKYDTESVRWDFVTRSASPEDHPRRREQFDAWLQEERAKAWYEGVLHAERCEGGMACEGGPYRNG